MDLFIICCSFLSGRCPQIWSRFSLNFEFQVIRGGDGMAGFAVKNPAGEIVHPYQWQAQSDYSDGSSMGNIIPSKRNRQT